MHNRRVGANREMVREMVAPQGAKRHSVAVSSLLPHNQLPSRVRVYLKIETLEESNDLNQF